MDIVQLCEIGMLIAFGASWPFNISKSWSSRTAKGKSVVFEFIVVFGYIIGVIGNWVWSVIDLIYLVVKGNLLLIE